MPWTRDEQLAALMRLPWTISIGPSEFGEYLVGRVAELPDAIATGPDERALARDLYESLKASLASRLEADADVPLPRGAELPWAHVAEPPRRAARLFQVRRMADGEAWTKSTGAFAVVAARKA
jgi:hypothetical protein